MSRIKIDRNKGIIEMRIKQKKSFRQIAKFFGIDVKTVYQVWERDSKRQTVDKVGITA